MYSTLGASQLMQRSEISRWRARALSSVLIVDENDEAVQQRSSLPAGLLLQAQQAEPTADAA